MYSLTRWGECTFCNVSIHPVVMMHTSNILKFYLSVIYLSKAEKKRKHLKIIMMIMMVTDLQNPVLYHFTFVSQSHPHITL